MEQTMSKNAKPLLMMKALVLAYAVTGILLLVLAFLLYKLGLGESQVNLGIMVIYILSSLLGGFYMGKKVKIRRFLWGIRAHAQRVRPPADTHVPRARVRGAGEPQERVSGKLAKGLRDFHGNQSLSPPEPLLFTS